jgi:hypothetical protein
MRSLDSVSTASRPDGHVNYIAKLCPTFASTWQHHVGGFTCGLQGMFRVYANSLSGIQAVEPSQWSKGSIRPEDTLLCLLERALPVHCGCLSRQTRLDLVPVTLPTMVSSAWEAGAGVPTSTHAVTPRTREHDNSQRQSTERKVAVPRLFTVRKFLANSNCSPWDVDGEISWWRYTFVISLSLVRRSQEMAFLMHGHATGANGRERARDRACDRWPIRAHPPIFSYAIA